MTDKLSSKVTTISQLEAINNIIDDMSTTTSYTAECPDLTASNGVITWNVTHNLGTRNVICSLYHGTEEVTNKGVVITSDNDVTITFNDNNVNARDYKVVIIASGSTISVSDNDGQWVNSYMDLFDEENYPTSTDTIVDLSSYLPNDTSSYEVLLCCYHWRYSTAGHVRVEVSTQLVDNVYAINSINPESSRALVQNTFILPVGSNHTITINKNEWSQKGQFYITAFAYKRLGTNVEKATKSLSNITGTGKIAISHNAMPSDKYIDLELGVSDSIYTAPSDGWFQCIGVGIDDELESAVWFYNSVDRQVQYIGFGTVTICGEFAVKKGEKVHVGWSRINFNYGSLEYLGLRFYYAVGSEHEAE